MTTGFWVKEIHVGGSGYDYTTGMSSKYAAEDEPFAHKNDAIRAAKDFYNSIPQNAPAVDYQVVTNEGEVVWSHPKNLKK